MELLVQMHVVLILQPLCIFFYCLTLIIRTSIIRTLDYLYSRLSELSHAQAMYICACIDGVAVDLQEAW